MTAIHIHAPPATGTLVQVRFFACRKWETVCRPKTFDKALPIATNQLRRPNVKESRIVQHFEWYDPDVRWQAAIHPYPIKKAKRVTSPEAADAR